MRRLLFALLLLPGAVASAPALAFPDEFEPGTTVRVDPAALPAPYAEPSTAAGPRRVERGSRRPRVPQGFTAELFAEGLDHARWLLAADNGDVFLAQSRLGEITLLRDTTGDGRADTIAPFADGFHSPTGMALHDGRFWVADLAGVWTAPYTTGADHPDGPFMRLTPPGALGRPGGHWTRTLAIHPDGGSFFVGIGSLGNIAEEPEVRASVQRFAIDGSEQTTLASGLRNPVGLAFQPGTDHLYTVVNERDGLGDPLVPDYLTRLEPNAFFGWPYAYLDGRPQPGFAERRPDLVEATRMPQVLFRSHSAPLGLAFYDGDQFPADYHGDAFVALHGSWNAEQPRGYLVARVRFTTTGPAENAYEVFATGFRLPETTRADRNRARVWGRPVGLAVHPDGSLLVSDDAGQTVWRIAWVGTR
ncbi:PQQ-dependent sugar dehydrogenase [Roseospirillum parvum]|uniref:Glucose/arabinose dehydrogenase, beta-propeller fold n=1 Tax=Roseospirillum parvum TaxID=83401 RepID=A0A1G8DRN9_9PROT|nr:PQQ-dependent sugar dehydrogenase [Roseospirillum parvum]SDH60211.1 Glucose/arabinose dehydrogenase, beta-propeller fold [Roseospirillum parvum]